MAAPFDPDGHLSVAKICISGCIAGVDGSRALERTKSVGITRLLEVGGAEIRERERVMRGKAGGMLKQR